mmetsp:Transcript_22452/g.33320  ORF Transcript_22452/g.33320 Transcript_22452/m.33320 type:complete len:83 (-) Transcript_22452:489-737(-)
MMPIKAIYNMLPLSSSCYDFTALASNRHNTYARSCHKPQVKAEEKCRCPLCLSGLLTIPISDAAQIDMKQLLSRESTETLPI